MKSDNTQLAERISALLQRIAVAFAGVPRPAITHSVARGFDDEWVLSLERGRELTALDSEQSWTDVTDEAVETFQEYFCFADAEGWRFYLPAHMSYYLRHLGACGSQAVYFACTRGDRLDLLNDEQLACVIEFLELVHAQEFQGAVGPS